MKSEKEEEHKRNISNMTQVDYYKSPWKDKDATTVNDTAYTFLNSYDDEISVITELKYDEHKEHSVIEKGTSHFNIFKCGRNLLYQLDVTYQRAFMASQVQEGLYQPYPA